MYLTGAGPAPLVPDIMSDSVFTCMNLTDRSVGSDTRAGILPPVKVEASKVRVVICAYKSNVNQMFRK